MSYAPVNGDAKVTITLDGELFGESGDYGLDIRYDNGHVSRYDVVVASARVMTDSDWALIALIAAIMILIGAIVCYGVYRKSKATKP